MVFNSLFGSLNFGGGGMIMNIIIIGYYLFVVLVYGFGLKRKSIGILKLNLRYPGILGR